VNGNGTQASTDSEGSAKNEDRRRRCEGTRKCEVSEVTVGVHGGQVKAMPGKGTIVHGLQCPAKLSVRAGVTEGLRSLLKALAAVE
jgi:hypothetical protein